MYCLRCRLQCCMCLCSFCKDWLCPDRVHSIFGKKCFHTHTWLCQTFPSLSTSSCLSCWKFVYVQPVTRKCDCCYPANYCTVALLPCISGGFEFIHNMKVLHHLLTHDLLFYSIGNMNNSKVIFIFQIHSNTYMNTLVLGI